MYTGTGIQFIHETITQTLRELGVSDSGDARTVMLTRGGFCIGRRFLFDDVQAVWRMDENVIHFYGQDGGLLRVVEAEQSCPDRKAA